MIKDIIRRLLPQDASALTALIRRCYADTYGPSVFYDEPALAEMIATQKLCAVVAENGQQLVGHMALTVQHPESIICETGNTIVDPSARGQGLLLKLGMALHQLVLEKGYVGYVHYPTTAHPIMQRASVAYGGKETGVMLAYVSETTTPELADKASKSLAATVVFQPLSTVPNRQVILPEKYQTVIARLYKNLNLDRTIVKSMLSSKSSSIKDTITMDVHYCSQRNVLHLFDKCAGTDAKESVSALIEKYQPKITHIDLPLDNPNIDSMLASLNDIGFFFCALLPEFAHTDVLRLQAITSLSEEELALNLVNEDAKILGDFICKSAC